MHHWIEAESNFSHNNGSVVFRSDHSNGATAITELESAAVRQDAIAIAAMRGVVNPAITEIAKAYPVTKTGEIASLTQADKKVHEYRIKIAVTSRFT